MAEGSPVRQAVPGAPPVVDGHISGRRTSSLTLNAAEVRSAPNPELLALSEDEAAWLDRHAYPTPEELQMIHSFDAEVLEDRLRTHRDAKAGVLLGHQLMANGDFQRAVSVLGAAATTGSIYAMQQHGIARLERARAEGMSDAGWQLAFVATMEMSRMLGDHNADILIQRHAPDFDRRRHADAILRQVNAYMSQHGAEAQLRGRRATGPDPRPNVHEWRRLEVATELDEFQIFDRRRR